MQIPNRVICPLDEKIIHKEWSAGKEVVVQYAEASYDDKVLSQINELCARYDKNFAIRFYGFYAGPFDCNTLLKIPNVKNLHVDCLVKADNIPVLGQLQHLEKLSVGVYELQETEMLSYPNLKRLTALVITETKTKAFNLGYLKEYTHLKFLMISGHSKNIEAIGELSSLEFLSLNSVKQVPVHFINKLKKLRTLRFILGGRDNIREIAENEIEYLEIVWVRGFNDLSNISQFKKLKTLLVEDNAQLRGIQFDQRLDHLENLRIINCKTFNSLTGLENLPSLKELWINKTALDFEKLIHQKLPTDLKTFAFYTGRKKESEEIKQILESKGFVGM